MKKLLLTACTMLAVLEGNAQTYTSIPITLSGFNADIVANGTGHSNLSSNNSVDALTDNYCFVAQDFVSSKNLTPISYLPANGIINSVQTTGLSFQLAPYSSNNSLRVAGIGSGTLTFTTPQAADQVCVLATTAYSSTVNITVNFSDGSNQVFTGQSFPNWYGGTGFAIKGVSRVNRTNDVIENNINDPRIYQLILTISPGNTTKTIQKITFDNTSAGSYLQVMGVTARTMFSNDIGITAIPNVISGCGLSNQHTVTVKIQNNGTLPQSNFPVSYQVNSLPVVTETFTGTLAPAASIDYSFTTKADFATTGTYSIVAKTILATDSYTGNDSFTKSIVSSIAVATFPYTEGFENGAGSWTSGGTNSSWALGTPSKNVINSAATGTKSWVTNLTGLYNSSENSYVVGPCFSFSTLTHPIFEMKAWWNTDFSVDGAVLQSSLDGGATWQNVGTKGDPNNWYNDNAINGAPGGQNFATAEGWSGRNSTGNGSNGWVTVKHALSGLGGKSNVLLRIAFGADVFNQDDGFAFDDVMIYEAPANDGGVTAITSPNTGCGLTNQETVTITIKNLGGSVLQNIPVSYTVDAVTVVNEVVPGPIAPNATVTYSFTTKANLGNPGTYFIVAKTNIPGDALTANDATAKAVTARPTIIALPYVEGFENGNGGWTSGGVSSSWALGTPAKKIINSAAAGTKAWVTSLTGQYNLSENSYVESPCFNFSGIADPDFEMKVWWHSEDSYDGTVLQSSIDGGATWQNVGANGDPYNWYNDNTISGAPGGQLATSAQGWTGGTLLNNGSGGWVKVKHKLTGLGGKSSVMLRIAFGSDSYGIDEGFAFDEIRIGDNTNNLSVNSITPINKLCGFSASEPIIAEIENLGSIPATGFTVSYTVNKGAPVSQNYTGNLAPNTPINITLPGANLSTAGSYTIKVTVKMPGDPEAANDTATYTISNATFTGLPPVFDFEPSGQGLTQLRKVTKVNSAIVENVNANFGAGTKGIIMDGASNLNWVVPTGLTDPWTSNTENFSGVYICFNPSGGAAQDSLLLSFDLKQLFKTASSSTNFRVTVDGNQVGPTYRPPFLGTPIAWQHIVVDLSKYQKQPGIQIGLESSVKEAYANGNGTANLVDNINIKRVSGPTSLKNDALQSQINVFPNPGNGIFNVNLQQGKSCTLEVTDLTGKVVKKQSAKEGINQLNLEGEAKGIYLLKVSGENGTAVRKLIVE